MNNTQYTQQQLEQAQKKLAEQQDRVEIWKYATITIVAFIIIGASLQYSHLIAAIVPCAVLGILFATIDPK